MKSKKIRGLIAVIGATTIIAGSLVGCGEKKDVASTENGTAQTQIQDNTQTDNGIKDNSNKNSTINSINDNKTNKENAKKDAADVSAFIQQNNGKNDIKGIVDKSSNKADKTSLNDTEAKNKSKDKVERVTVKKDTNKNNNYVAEKVVSVKVNNKKSENVVHNNNKVINNVKETGNVHTNKPTEKPVIKHDKPAEKPHKEENKVIKTMYVTADVLNVRAGAGTDFDKIGELTRGTKVEVVKSGESWNKIKFDGKYGYVFNKYLANSKPANKPLEKPVKPTENNNKPVKPAEKPHHEKVLDIAYVNTKTLDVKAKKSEDSKTLGTLKYGTKVEVVGQDGGWYKINYKNGTGYVYLYLTNKDNNNIKYDYMEQLSKETFDAINKFRVENGVEPLKYSQECANVAKEQALECAKKVTADHSFNEIGLYNYTGTVESFINQWANLPLHKKNMLNPNSKLAGVGVYKDSIGRYFVICKFAK